MRYALFYLNRLLWLPWIPVSICSIGYAPHAPPCVTYLCTAPCHKVWLWYLQQTYSMGLYVTARSSFSVQQQTSHETMRTKGQIMKRFFVVFLTRTVSLTDTVLGSNPGTCQWYLSEVLKRRSSLFWEIIYTSKEDRPICSGVYFSISVTESIVQSEISVSVPCVGANTAVSTG